ncbi:hypothetical protein PsorP6_015977 [Peronosclerospora sorghi]|uniref:Uncharacterized protein n=1 Tax=Peronosclerospora sorghi TaxID=230839 RepID=A0ACC0WMQ1_9STRA|nr:hypothetical protein PsorP6_015977 [Peronosclerospora sorghi]
MVGEIDIATHGALCKTTHTTMAPSASAVLFYLDSVSQKNPPSCCRKTSATSSRTWTTFPAQLPRAHVHHRPDYHPQTPSFAVQ